MAQGRARARAGMMPLLELIDLLTLGAVLLAIAVVASSAR